MIPPDVLWPFFAASIALALAPGPDNIFVLTHAAQHGRAAGIAVTLGLCSGLVLHTSAVALGLAAILQAAPLALQIVQSIGGLYLLYLAWGAWRAVAQPLSTTRSGLSRFALYRRGVVMNVTNPKVSLFFIAFLPQFANPERGALAVQIAALGATFIAATLLVFGGIAVLAGALGGWLSRMPGAQRTVNALAACVLAALALRLLFALNTSNA